MSVIITVDLSDMPDMEDLPMRAFNSAAYAATRDIQAAAWSIVPFRTGKLIESMKVYVGSDGLRITFDRRGGLANEQIADVIDMGARPHKITAVKAKALNTPYGPRYSVNHPGYGGRGYILKMKEVARQIMTRRLIEALRGWQSI